jgi:hypothetical protein
MIETSRFTISFATTGNCVNSITDARPDAYQCSSAEPNLTVDHRRPVLCGT